VADEPSDRWSKIHLDPETYGGRRVFLGRAFEVRVCESGVGRFTKLGMPFPHFTASFVGGLEIGGGLLLLAGLTTRLIAIPFVAEMIVAILSTKISMYLGRSPLPLPPALPQVGFWAVLHEVRSEYAQLLTALFLMLNGPGVWSLDAVLRKQRKSAIAQLVATPIALDLSAAASR